MRCVILLMLISTGCVARGTDQTNYLRLQTDTAMESGRLAILIVEGAAKIVTNAEAADVPISRHEAASLMAAAQALSHLAPMRAETRAGNYQIRGRWRGKQFRFTLSESDIQRNELWAGLIQEAKAVSQLAICEATLAAAKAESYAAHQDLDQAVRLYSYANQRASDWVEGLRRYGGMWEFFGKRMMVGGREIVFYRVPDVVTFDADYPWITPQQRLEVLRHFWEDDNEQFRIVHDGKHTLRIEFTNVFTEANAAGIDCKIAEDVASKLTAVDA